MKKRIIKNRTNKVFYVNSSNVDVLDEIKKNSIDLIFMDIRFFRAYSIRTVQLIIDKNPDMLFVYYGMMSEFAYMDKCMEISGVMSIFRPLKPSDIDTALNSSLNIHEANLKKQHIDVTLKERCNADFAMFKNKFLTALVKGNIDNENEINRSLQYYNIDLGNSYRVLSFRIDKFRKVILTLEEFEKNLLLYKMIEVIEENLSNCKKCMFTYEFNSIIVIISTDQQLSDLVLDLVKVKDDIYKKLKIQTTVGVGRHYKNIKDVSTSYNEAEAGLKYRYHLGYYSVIPIEHVEPNNFITYKFPKEDEYKLVCAAVIGEYIYCKKLLTNIIESIEDLEIPHSLFSKIIMNIIISIARYCEEQFHDYNYEITSFFNFSEIIKITNIKDTYNYLDLFLQNFCKHVNEIRVSEDLKIFEKAKSLIEKEYMKTFSLTDLANDCNTSPEYLNKIFAEHFGSHVIEYILKIRLDVAKSLMRETRKTDDVIALAIGFSTTKYFRSVFEINEKMSTIEYRKRYGVFYFEKDVIKR